GFSLRRPVAVVFMHAGGLVSHVRGRPCAGFALSAWDMIVVSPPRGLSMRELVRHELAHLFAGLCGRPVPSLTSEGLATSLQEAEGGVSIDEATVPPLRHRGLRLPAMV